MRALQIARRRGFTLTEMLAALGLGVIIMLVVTSVFSQATGLFTVSSAKIRAVSNARVAMQFIEADIQGAFGDGRLFIGIHDAADLSTAGYQPGVDNDGDNLVNEDPTKNGTDEDSDGKDGEDPYDFTYDDSAGAGLYNYLSTIPEYRYRSGLEVATMSMFSFDASGQAIPYTHVLYYVTKDRKVGDYTVGRLVRANWDDGASPNSFFDFSTVPTASWIDDTADQNYSDFVRSRIVAFGVVGFRVRYFYYDDGLGAYTWTDSWDSTGGDPEQQLQNPEVVQVELSVIDRKGALARKGNRPYTLTRLIEVSATTP